MIRDPSDGSVREEITQEANSINSIVAKRRAKEITSGLVPPDKDQLNEAEQIKRSREWFENYHKRKA